MWVMGAAVAAGAGVAAAVNRRRLPRVWIGLYLEDGMFIPLGKGEPEAPELRARAGDVIRALRTYPGRDVRSERADLSGSVHRSAPAVEGDV
jgi:hypothetical protein